MKRLAFRGSRRPLVRWLIVPSPVQAGRPPRGRQQFAAACSRSIRMWFLAPLSVARSKRALAACGSMNRRKNVGPSRLLKSLCERGDAKRFDSEPFHFARRNTRRACARLRSGFNFAGPGAGTRHSRPRSRLALTDNRESVGTGASLVRPNVVRLPRGVYGSFGSVIRSCSLHHRLGSDFHRAARSKRCRRRPTTGSRRPN